LNIVTLSNNIPFLRLLLHSIERTNPEKDVFVYSDYRISDPKDFKGIETERVHFVDLNVVEYLKEWLVYYTGISLSVLENMYIDYQTHHIKLGVILHRMLTGEENFLFLDDDVLVNSDLDILDVKDGFAANRTTGVYGSMRRGSFWGEERCAWKRVFKQEFPEDVFSKFGMYNAGTMYIDTSFDAQFLESLSRFYYEKHFHKKFFEKVFNPLLKQYISRSRAHVSFFDEQRFLTYFFYSTGKHKSYSLKEAFLINWGIQRFKKLFPTVDRVKKNFSTRSVIHYCLSKKQMFFEILKAYEYGELTEERFNSILESYPEG